MEDDDDEAILAFIFYRHKSKRKPRRWSIREIFKRRALLGEIRLVQDLRTDPEYHHCYFRMDIDNYNYLLHKIWPKLIKQNTHGHPISPEMRLAITLRFLASGSSQVSLAMSYRVSPSSVSKILREVMTALWNALKEEFMPVPDQESWIQSAREFQDRWQFPNCCGAIDGKHVRVKSYSNSATIFYNYKNYFSIVLLAVLDANYKFTLIDVGAPGSQSDSGILSQSLIGVGMDDGSLNFPGNRNLPGSHLRTPHVLLGDGGFALKPAMMKPFPRDKHLNKEKRAFNYRLSRARRVSENGFGILAARFRVFHKVLECDYDLAVLITKVSIAIHNFLMVRNDMNNITVDREENGSMIPGNWRETCQSSDGIVRLPNIGSNNFTIQARQTRNTFMKYFSTPEFALPWQDRVTNEGYE